MKNIIYSIAFGFVLLCGCTGVKTTTIGLENEALLAFVGRPGNYTGGIDVNLDDKIKFKASVNKPNKARPQGNVYAISTGNHAITVSYNGKVIFKDTVFILAQETKQIMLP